MNKKGLEQATEIAQKIGSALLNRRIKLNVRVLPVDAGQAAVTQALDETNEFGTELSRAE